MEASKFCLDEMKDFFADNNNWLTSKVFHSIIPHIFLPRKLPQEKELDNADVNILRATSTTVEAFSKYLPSLTVTLFRTWASLQCGPGLDAIKVMESISSLEDGQMLALYLPAQNCGIVFSKILEDKNYVILSTFPASVNNNLVVTSPTDVKVIYPEQSIKIPVSDLLKSETFSKQLVFLHSTELDMAMPKSRKSGHEVTEVRDVAGTKFISEWLAAALSDKNSNVSLDSEFQKIVKKVRDEVIWKNAYLPFRRSGIWMTIKVALQLNLIFELGTVKGRFMYKLLILCLMTKICSFWKYTESIDIDLARQMIAKIARRLEKLQLDSKHEDVVSSELTQLHINIHENARKIIENVRSVMDLKFKNIYDAHIEDGLLQPLENLNFTQDIIHKIPNVTKYIKIRTEPKCDITNINTLPDPKYWPRYRSEMLQFPPTSFLTSLTLSDEIGAGFTLKDVENWILMHLEESEASTEEIRELAFQYAGKAMSYYNADPVGASQMILTILKMVQKVDQISCKKFPLLTEHKTGLNLKIIQELLLPCGNDLERAAKIESYFTERENAATFPSLVEEDTASPLSFSVRYASYNENMQQVRISILQEAEVQIASKLKEFDEAKKQVQNLRTEYNGLSCTYSSKYDKYGQSYVAHSSWCHKCRLKSQINNYSVSVYERPLRNEVYNQNAVVFELLIPNEIACLRDLVHLLAFDICRIGGVVPNVSISGWWSNHSALSKYAIHRQKRVHLGSTAKLFAQSHYSSIHPDRNSRDIIVDCGYNCIFYGQYNLQLTRQIQLDTVKQWTTLKVENGTPYEKLQWALQGKTHSQNQILAILSECSQKMSLAEFKEFGTIRAGHRLQMRNIYRAVETNILSFKNESVVSLILQTLWEAGPSDGQTLIRESHEDFIVDSIFTLKMIENLESFLKLQENNWNEHRNLLVIIAITCRIIELTTELSVSYKAVDLLLNCRRVTLKWMTDVENVLSKSKEPSDIAELRNNLIDVALYCSLTFFIDSNSEMYIRIFEPVLVQFKEDDKNDNPPKYIPGEIAWLLSVVKRDNNIVLNSTAIASMPVARRNLIRVVNRIGVTMENEISETIQRNGPNINEFTREQWAGAIGGIFSTWKPHPDPAKQVLYSQMIDKNLVTHWIQFDLILGKFLVDGNPISRLPDRVTNHADFQRVYRGTIFEVQPSGNNTFCTTAKYSDCSYFFSIVDNNLIVSEQDKDGNSSELIPHCHLSLEIPFLLIENYSHWWKSEENLIHFRPKNFSNTAFAHPDGIEYTLNLNTKLLTENNTGRNFTDIMSLSFAKIMKWLNRFEDIKYCHILTSKAINGISEIEIELPRTGLHFTLENNQLISREYIGKQISCQQTFGTFIGLRNGLLLEDCNSYIDKEKVFIAPHGTIQTHAQENHQIVSISVENLREPPFFTYEVDERLRQIKAGKSYAAWFYLVQLHAVTSCPLPDPFTGMTGTENAFRILQSGWCWSSEPFEGEVLRTMEAIKQLTPTRSYYPKHVESMQSILWPPGVSTCATHEMYLNVINQLIYDSQRLDFLFPNKTSANSRLNTKPEGVQAFLSERAYWRHLCYNPNSKIEKIFEEKIMKNSSNATTPNQKEIPEDIFRNIKILSSLAHSWTFILPDESSHNLLKRLLLLGSDLQGASPCNIEFISFPLNKWLQIDIRNHWLDLYNFARNVEENNHQSQWRLMLSLFAYLGNNTNDLLILHTIATNPTFFRNIHPPPYTSYLNPSQQTFDSGIIRSVFSSYAKDEDFFLSSKGYGSIRSYYSDEDREIIAEHVATYKRKIKNQLQNLTDEIESMWPCNTVNNSIYYVSASLINLSDALTDVNAQLNSWNNNRKLGVFIKTVSVKLNYLQATQNGHLQMNPNSWVVKLLDIPQQRRFEINYEEKMALNFQNQPEVSNSTDIAKATNLSNFEDTLKYQKQQYESLWNQLEQLIVPPDQQYLVQAGLYPRIVPILMLPKILKPKSELSTNGLRSLTNLIQKIGTQLSLEMRASRIVKLSRGGRQTEVALQRELEAIPHENWDPAETPEWLLFELEMNMTIRRIQVEVAKQMLNPPGGNHSVMQLNMGEGKTAVIVPILASILSNGSQLCRVTVLKSLFRTNFGSLRQCLGGMLNRRIYSFPCRRDMTINQSDAVNILESYKECEKLVGIVMTLPEYRLSFQLKTYESGKKKQFPTSQAMMEINQWLNSHARDILDESDEILHAKYQLIYTVGEQLPPGGGNLRWTIIQSLLKLVATELKKLWKKYGDSRIEFDENFDIQNGPHIFSPCRLLSDDIYSELMDGLTRAFLDGNSSIPFLSLPMQKRKIIESFLTDTAISPDDHEKALQIFDDNTALLDTTLILAGYLKYEVLRLALTKRWRVNYGVNPTGQRKMAVPFKAKDVAAEMTEFGHPDVAICLTHLSYYYSGLTNEQILECFKMLDKIPNPDEQYIKWISKIPKNEVHDSIKEYNGINLKNATQRNKHLFPVLRNNMYVIDFWLSHMVFPREAKQFAGKMMCTAWDLVSEEQSLTVSGFSGTNDSKLLLPLPIMQNDLKELEDTNENVRKTLELEENDSYESLPPNVSGRSILENLAQKEIPVLLDAGALMLEFDNETAATEWLKIVKAISSTTKIAAAVYFDTKNVLMVTDGKNRPREFELSPFRESLDRCVIYLDDAHTRGTDLKFPRGTKACVTLAGGITRDKTVQACMRMRLLGKGHTICFWGSQEADNGIREFCTMDDNQKIHTTNVVSWIYNNSRIFEKEGLVHWSAAGYNYAQKRAAHLLMENKMDSASLEELSERCTDKELIELMDIYGEPKSEENLTVILTRRLQHLESKYEELPVNSVLTELIKIREGILHRVSLEIPDKKRFAQLLDEEQEKELEHELEEERQKSRPGPATPAIAKSDQDIRKFLETGSLDIMANLLRARKICSLPHALEETSLWSITQKDGWGNHIFVTQDFRTVIQIPYPSFKVDEFLRPVNWIAKVDKKDRNLQFPVLLLLSPYEANDFFPVFRSNFVSTLHMFAPRMHPDHDNLLNTSEIQYSSKNSFTAELVPEQLEAQLAAFSGEVYFKTEKKQDEYCHFLGLIPQPRSTEHQQEFEEGNISAAGFVVPEHRCRISKEIAENCTFTQNPNKLIQGIVERRNEFFPSSSHAALIVLESKKGILPSSERETEE